MDGSGATGDIMREVVQLRRRVSELEMLAGELRAERDRTQRYLDVAGVILVVIGADERVVLLNKKGCEVLGCEEEEVVGRNWFESFLPKRVREDTRRVFASLVAGELQVAQQHENPILTRDGEERIIAWHNTVFTDQDGCIIGTISSGEDITERRQAERALSESETRYRNLFQHSADAICLTTRGGRFVDVNQAFLELFGYSQEAIKSITMADLYADPGEGRRFQEEIERKGSVIDREVKKRRHDGAIIDCLETAIVRRASDGSVAGYEGIIRDVTERRRAEAELRDSEERFKVLFEYAPDAYYLCDLQGTFLDGNRAAEQLLGYRRQELIGRSLFQTRLLPATELPRAAALLARNVLGRATGPDEFVLNREDGFQVIAEISTHPIKLRGASVVLGIARNVTSRREAEEVLRAGERRYRELFENSPVALWEEDASEVKRYLDELRASGVKDCRAYLESHPEEVHKCASLVKVLDVNRATLDLYGAKSKKELLEGLDRVFTEDSYEVFMEEVITIAEGGTRFDAETSARTLAGDRKDIALRWTVAPGHEKTFSSVLVSDLDITERKRAEEEIGHRTRQLALINKVGRAIAAILDVDLLLPQVVELIGQRFGYYAVSVFEVDPEVGDVVFRASTVEPAGRDQEGSRLKIGEEGIVGWVAGSGQTLVVDDVGDEPRYYSHPGLPDTRSELTVPIMLGQRVIGVLDVQSGELGAFDEDDVETFETLADALAVAIENARLYEKERRRSEELSALLDTAQALASSLELREVLEIIAQQAKALTQADGSRIYLLEPDGETLTPLVALGIEADEVMALPFRVGQGITGHVAATGIAEMVDDVKADPRSVHIPGTPEAQMCVLFAPLTIKGEVTGVMVVCRLGDRRFHDQDLHTAISMASHAATALQNARLYQALTEQELQLRRQIEEAPDTILNVDLQGHITLFNREAERLTGHQQSDVLGRPLAQLVRPDDLEQMEGLLTSEARSDALQQAHELEILDRWGERVPLEVRVSPLEKGGRLAGWQVIGRDVSQRKRLEEMKSQFIATVSHDLRTPLASIMGFSEMLMEGSPGPLTDIQTEFLGIIYDSSVRQLALVNDLLDVSKLEAGRLKLETEMVHLPELIWGVVEGMRPVAEKKGVTLILDVNDELPRTEGDPRRLERVFTNLLSNAVKFTPEGGNVEVAAWQDDGQLKVRVSDTGVGIPPEDLPNLFQPFHRGRNVTKKAIEGTGLGLTIVKALVEAHKGIVEVQSELDKGTTFQLTLPLHKDAPAETTVS